MTLSKRDAMLARLKSCAEGTIFEQQERLEGTAIAIRQMIRSNAPNANASELAMIARCFPDAFSGTSARRAVVAEFFDSFPDDLPAVRIAEGLENNHAQA
ncbi:hypothetical protein C0V97_00970 [Asaia sp. W19]|uniref:hypothetical protein n=1 Tax=unclassified Asaia TaxID=2685023 RepID=UPI000F8E6255|nr:hypothetical protein [Asaia sp. W19]RUT27371.1 hypothetical protein C0V97_00970 [Asaia sp. W19]